jgi:hypothetical protein
LLFNIRLLLFTINVYIFFYLEVAEISLQDSMCSPKFVLGV